ncbi:GNAT family N-acetyltransferase [Aridibaculum aurantiacum]|uniref:GNAT family N-acetyltransferase n=1 Tax=Aridibaculum aurantiacum TaxID=2810307 RepID=UPI001A96BA7D|nr:GNAT family N-acetyltransferase [Aridibaculum aurantiacum]
MIAIRLASLSDLPSIRQIYNDVILHTTAVYDYEAHSEQMMQEWFANKEKDGFPIFVAVDGDAVIGFSTFGPFRRWAAYQYTVENSVYVAETARGKGAGRLLLNHVVDAAKLQGNHCIVAGIDATNQASISLHQSVGFKEVAHFKEVGYKFGRWLDLKFLQLMLDTPAIG